MSVASYKLTPEGITYRGWAIDPYRQPDGCFYAYAPNYDGLRESDTQSDPTLEGLRAIIDEMIAERWEKSA